MIKELISFVLIFEMVLVVVLVVVFVVVWVGLVVFYFVQTLTHVIYSSFAERLIDYLVHLSSKLPLHLSRLAMEGLYPLCLLAEPLLLACVSAVYDW